MAIETRTLAPGTQLTARYRKQIHTCVVEQSEDGSVAYALTDGRRFKSPSAAGSAVMGGVACNGWRFWSLATAGTEAAAALTGKTVTGKTRGKAGKLFKRIPNQQGTPDDQTRWWCSGCMKAFLHLTGEVPTACPGGHRPEAVPA